METYKERIEKGEIECACDTGGKCGKHYFSCEFCQQSKKDCMCD